MRSIITLSVIIIIAFMHRLVNMAEILRHTV